MEYQSNQFLSLLRRFDKPGPRYTSYPPAPVFSEKYTVEDYLNDVEANNRSSSVPLSLYIHIPFCDTLCYFCGCTTIITKNRERVTRYLQFLKTEIELLSKYINQQREVIQIALGGGTPSYLTPAEIEELFTILKHNFRISDDAEISVELDPRELTYEQIRAFIKSGVNRFSIGVQDFNETVQRAVNRLQPKELTIQTMQWIQSFEIDNINFDLIYGLPFQTAESFSKTIDEVIELSPRRIAIFNFAYVPWLKPHQNLLPVEFLPSADLKLQLLQIAVSKLNKAGYFYIGMDHFAKPDDELTLEQQRKKLQRNFQGYTTKSGTDLYGIGMSAISHFGSTYSQNTKDINKYEELLKNNRLPVSRGYRMTYDDEIRKYVIMHLMCDMELSIPDVEQKYNIHFRTYFSEALEQLREFIELELVMLDDTTIRVSEHGRYVIRNIAMCFDAYLEQLTKSAKPLYSRTI